MVMTPKGVRAVAGGPAAGILERLNAKDMSLAELSKANGTAPSSLFFQIEKLIEAGLVVKSRIGQSKKTTKYRLSCRMIMGSMPRLDINKDFAPELMKCVLLGDSELAGRSMPWTFAAYLATIGLDIAPLLMDYGEFAADRFASLSDPKPEVTLAKVAAFLDEADGTVISVFSYSPLRVDIRPPQLVYGEGAGAMYAGLVARALSDGTGERYTAVPQEIQHGPSGFIRYLFTQSEDDFDMGAAVISAERSEDYARMCICEGKTDTFLVESDAQVVLLNTLEERPMCMLELLDRVDMPRSTVTSNLTKLMDMGAVEQLVSGCGTAYYGLACNLTLKRDRHVNDDVNWRNGIELMLSRGPGTFGYCGMMYLLYMLSRLGFDAGYAMRGYGSRIGDFLLLGRGETHRDEKVLVEWTRDVTSVSVSLANTIPPTIRVRKSSAADGYSRAAVMFYAGALAKILTGKEYRQYGKSRRMSVDGSGIVLYETLHTIYPPLSRSNVSVKSSQLRN